ncbi:Predicted transglutaminase-like cysteine proteinase [Jannaschia faecimaris]|uniref:Predicted transglutaminase-like cysteine proteinase n=1 Tax=Jannaschia faecimaris TaxID=1244108 RepID=A0A1H3S4X4_9RHOB|nr:transglutaminase-like cysteine peptidase [Jannaschia faecimaris]SDZ32924.1 Predicted transglutaminase-like cysteine proteinase [Jannaschia faecimaris]
MIFCIHRSAKSIRELLSSGKDGSVIARRAINIALVALIGSGATASIGHAANEGFLNARYIVASPAGATDLCWTYGWSCQSSPSQTAFSSAELATARRINQNVNRRVREITDQVQYSRLEHWALPTERGGDCEDLALLKQRDLIRAGIAPERLLIATALDRRRAAHAVLILRTDNEDLVLDNLTNSIKPWSRTGYSFLRMQNPENKQTWVAVMEGGIFSTDRAVAALGGRTR